MTPLAMHPSKPLYDVVDYTRYTRATQWLNGIGAVIAIVLGIYILADPVRRTSVEWVFWLVWPIAGLHTIEEYIAPGGFLRYFNSVAWRSESDYGPLTARRAFWTDAVAGAVNPVAILVLSNVYLPAVWFFVAILWINGFFHLTETLKTGRYFPGTVTGTVLYLPGFTAITYFYVERGVVSGWQLSAAFTAALLFTAGFFGQVRRWQRGDTTSVHAAAQAANAAS